MGTLSNGWITRGMSRFILFVIITIFLSAYILLTFSTKVQAESSKEELNVFVAYSTKDGEVNQNVRMLDMLIGHFTRNITFKSVHDVKKQDLSGISHLFYLGDVEAKLPSSFRNISEEFSGSYVAIGANVEQLGDSFSFVGETTEQLVSVKELIIDKGVNPLPETSLIYNVDAGDSATTLINGKYGEKIHPVFVQQENRYYFAKKELTSDFSLYLAEGLHHVFQSDKHKTRSAYIRLEDVHPMSDPKKLIDIAHFLQEKNIPYMITVIPVYTDPDTHKEYHYKDAPKVVEALQYMQDHGGSIILHGYTHQYRKSETGEGFEFWDVENNTPIYFPEDQNKKIRSRADFEDDKSYKEYVQTLKEFEKEYIREKITKGIQELVSHNLYPLAFEAPHYTMSLEGYQELSKYFSTYVGQLQLSNENWQVLHSAPYFTRPVFTGGMNVIPETIGYVQEGDPSAIDTMINKAHRQLILRDGVIGGFYHPYLGVETLKELINQMEKIPNIEWMDLKRIPNEVEVESVHITSGPEGIKLKKNLWFTQYNFNLIMESFRNSILWIMILPLFWGITVVPITLFISHIKKRKKQTRSFLYDTK
ncbi:polysaccharide deacetylase family protein [Bacillus sp. FJAT-47783]|uniref:DUF2334 domain-containing protein n=1 Tax=Bacillus sp. FJAT-47783 TaxID=2922712 RepID=UPI001FAE3D0D|nr:polysaccharide deacetylase family protein [Bacillus sp. FJAT-47783]